MTASERLAQEIGDLLVRYGTGGGFVVHVTTEGPLFARVEVIDAAEQRAYGLTVEELVGGRPAA